MNKGFLLIFAAFCVLAACKQDPKTSATPAADGQQKDDAQSNPTVLAGHWIAMDFCARAAQYGSVLGAMNNGHIPYALAMTFNPGEPDSVLCYNGMKEWKRPVKIKTDTIEVIGASNGKSVFLVYNSKETQDITMFDGTGNSGTQMDKYIKSKANAQDGLIAFNTALNYYVFSGVFMPIGKPALGDNIQFTPNGTINNFKEYDQYKLCIAGDCFVTGDKMDVAYLSKSRVENSEKMYGFNYSVQNDTLTMYNLINKNPQEKAAYVVGSVAYKFLRKPQVIPQKKK